MHSFPSTNESNTVRRKCTTLRELTIVRTPSWSTHEKSLTLMRSVAAYDAHGRCHALACLLPCCNMCTDVKLGTMYPSLIGVWLDWRIINARSSDGGHSSTNDDVLAHHSSYKLTHLGSLYRQRPFLSMSVDVQFGGGVHLSSGTVFAADGCCRPSRYASSLWMGALTGLALQI